MLKDVKVPGLLKPHRPTKVLTIDAHTADLIRKVARADGIQMSAFLDQCLKAYLQLKHPDWKTEENDG